MEKREKSKRMRGGGVRSEGKERMNNESEEGERKENRDRERGERRK